MPIIKLNWSRVASMLLINSGVALSAFALSTYSTSQAQLSSLLEITNDVATGESITGLTEYEVMEEDQEVLKVTKGVASINIPDLKIKAPILEGTSRDVLRYSAGHFKGTAKIGQEGNFCIAGHSSSIYNCIFNGIDKINLGDIMYMTNKKGKTYCYYVTDKLVVEPTQLEVLNQTQGVKECTVITCTNGGKQRLCIIGKIMSKSEYKEFMKSVKSDRYSDVNQVIGVFENCDFSYRIQVFDDSLDLTSHEYSIDKREDSNFKETITVKAGKLQGFQIDNKKSIKFESNSSKPTIKKVSVGKKELDFKVTGGSCKYGNKQERGKRTSSFTWEKKEKGEEDKSV